MTCIKHANCWYRDNVTFTGTNFWESLGRSSKISSIDLICLIGTPKNFSSRLQAFLALAKRIFILSMLFSYSEKMILSRSVNLLVVLEPSMDRTSRRSKNRLIYSGVLIKSAMKSLCGLWRIMYSKCICYALSAFKNADFFIRLKYILFYFTFIPAYLCKRCFWVAYPLYDWISFKCRSSISLASVVESDTTLFTISLNVWEICGTRSTRLARFSGLILY